MNTSTSIPASAIGVSLAKKRAAFLKFCDDLRDATDSEYDALLGQVDQPLRDAIGAMSVIGQVKAGKTSLLNSFMGKTDFLPSDVNPWTAVVTSLFFDKPDGPTSGADFAFFDDAQWQKFTSRDGRLAELADSIPGDQSKMDSIANEVAEMRQRAEMRLGEQFHALLGKTHKFNEVSTDVLARYICAGDDPEAKVRNPVVGRFADITREANVYFENERFGFPIKLIDTPGLNDPLLIREEITLQCLEYSDIFVLVLSAHQAFSSSDLYLLRVLNALRLDRLVVFVNRVDELNNPAADIPDIKAHVENMLAQENPDANIPVLFGSAVWAEQALNGTVPAGDEDKIQYFVKNQLAKNQSDFDEPELAKAWVASGLPALDDALSEMLDGNLGETWLKSARIDLHNAIQIIRGDADEQLAILTHQRAVLNDENPPDLDEDVAKRQADFEKIELNIGTLFQQTKVALETTNTASFTAVQRGLSDLVEAFITSEITRFATFFGSAKSKSVNWSCDPAPLRSSLNRYFRSEFPDIQQTVLDTLESETKIMTDKLVELGLKEAANIQLNTAQLQDMTPNTTALSKVVSFDMGGNWWKGWFGRMKSLDDATDILAKMIRKQFLPIQGELLDSAAEKLAESSRSAITSFETMQKTLLENRKNQTTNRQRDLSGSFEDVENRIAALEKRAEICELGAKMMEAA